MMYYLFCRREDNDTILVSTSRSALISYYNNELPFCDVGTVQSAKNKAELSRVIRDLSDTTDVRIIKNYDVEFYSGKEIFDAKKKKVEYTIG